MPHMPPRILTSPALVGCWARGYHDRYAGVPETACPYTRHAYEWKEGWLFANAELLIKRNMKTLVKYVAPSTMLSIRWGKKSRVVSAQYLVAHGLGENTVQEDGVTVHLAEPQWRRLEGPVGREQGGLGTSAVINPR